MLSMNYRTIEKRAEEISMLISVGRFKFIDKKTAFQIADKERLRFSGLKCVRQIVSDSSERKTLKFLLERGEVDGEKDASGMWRIKEADVEKIKKRIKSVKEGVIIQDGITYYSIARASRDAAALLAEPGTERYKAERNRLNKRFQRQVYETRIGQIISNGKYYISEPVYMAMINPATLKKGMRTYLRCNKKPRDANNGDSNNKQKLEKIAAAAPLKKTNAPKPIITKPYLTREELREKYPSVQQVNIVQSKYEIKVPNESADKNAPCLDYNYDNPPLLGKCAKGRTIRFNEMLGIIMGYDVRDKFRPQIRVQFPGEKEEKFQHLNLIVRAR